jgi:DNA-binding transcriptional LysR family regulator
MTNSPPHLDPIHVKIDALARLDSRQLRVFLAIVREKSFTVAAQKLNMTQPALSRSIQLLEDRLGVRLIERTSKSFGLTKFGRVMVDRALLIEREFDLLLRELSAVQDGTTGAINLGVGRSAIGYISPTIQQFQRERPGTSVNITVDTAEANYKALLNGELDIICAALNFPKQAHLVSEKITDIQNIVLADMNHPLCGKRDVSAPELAEYPWILFSRDELGYERICSFFAAKNITPPKPAIETNAVEVLLGLLRDGPYLASVPALILPQARALGLDEVDVHGAFWSVPIGTIYMRSSTPPLAVTSLALILRQHFA